jgi:hypothetical protein
MSNGRADVTVDLREPGGKMRSDAETLSPQPWPWSGHPRVLVEHPDRATSLAFATALRQAGYTVAVCPGPESQEPCPLAGHEGCAIAHDADAVFFSLGLGSPPAREILQALKTSFPATPILVEATPGEAAEWQELVRGCRLVPPSVIPDQLVLLVGEALASPVGG